MRSPPLGDVKHTCLRHLKEFTRYLFRSVKRHRNGTLILPQMVYFPSQGFFPLYRETPEKTLWDWEIFIKI